MSPLSLAVLLLGIGSVILLGVTYVENQQLRYQVREAQVLLTNIELVLHGNQLDIEEWRQALNLLAGKLGYRIVRAHQSQGPTVVTLVPATTLPVCDPLPSSSSEGP